VPTRNGKLKTGLLARESFANLASFPSSLSHSRSPSIFHLARKAAAAPLFLFMLPILFFFSVAWQRDPRGRTWKRGEKRKLMQFLGSSR